MDTASGTTAPDKPRMAITPVPGSVLENLLAQEHAAEAAQKEAYDRLKGLRDQVKAELTQAHPDITAFDIAGTPHRPAKTLNWVNTVRLDTKRLKAEQPRIYVDYAEFGGKWVLSPARGL
jgi:predicted phage-related endonuclease